MENGTQYGLHAMQAKALFLEAAVQQAEKQKAGAKKHDAFCFFYTIGDGKL